MADYAHRFAPHRFVRRLNGPRGSALLALALIAAPFAVAYSPLTYYPEAAGEIPALILPPGLTIISSVVPITFYGLLWAVGAVLCVAAAWTDKTGHQRDGLDRAAWGVIVGLVVVWALAYIVGWSAFLLGMGQASSARSYILGGIYAGMALFIAICSRAMPCREADLETMRQIRFRALVIRDLPWRRRR